MPILSRLSWPRWRWPWLSWWLRPWLSWWLWPWWFYLWRRCGPGRQCGEAAANHGDHGLTADAASEGEDVVGRWPLPEHGLIVARLEQNGPLLAQAQSGTGDPHLDASITRSGEPCLHCTMAVASEGDLHFAQLGGPSGEVDQAPVVGI